VLRLADVVFVLHDGDAALVSALSGRTARVVNNPVAGSPEPVDHDASTDRPRVLFLGEQSRRKGADVLAAAWPAVLAACPSAELVVAGPVPEGGVLHGPGVHNLGPVPPEAARSLLRQAALVVLPSRAEALPMVLLEAMAEGVPFVATGVAGIGRLAAEGGGLLVRVGDADDLARSIVRLLGDPELRASLGRAGRTWWAASACPPAVHATLRAGYRAPAGRGLR
jgi:glycosyltransferase involved in cell wall biosynthesis